MAKLIYTTICSLDGYVADADGKFDWSEPDAEVHLFVNDLERSIGTYLFGRRLYDVMKYWESHPSATGEQDFAGAYAEIWRSADKVVYSTTLDAVSTERTRLERTFDVEAVRRLKASADRDLGIGGPTFAAHAFDAGLVDECHFFLVPIVVGGGRSSLPANVRIGLKLLSERRFGNGTVHLHYERLLDVDS